MPGAVRLKVDERDLRFETLCIDRLIRRVNNQRHVKLLLVDMSAMAAIPMVTEGLSMIGSNGP
ncbi:MAG: hypothetical protein ACI8TQ_000411 [Planctomycetota bacterium]|jgi:hypothetical protein